MADNGAAGGKHVEDGSHGEARPQPTTPQSSPSRTPLRRRAGTTPPSTSRLSPAGSSTALPPPRTPPTPPADLTVTGSSSSSVGTLSIKRTKSVICPICHKDMYHERALCGHIRWHTPEERSRASGEIARALASSFVVPGNGEEEQGSSKRFKVPDLNKPPPPEDDDGA